MAPMNSQDSLVRRHRGSAGVVVVFAVVFLVLAAVGGSFFLGSRAQERFNAHLEEGRLAVEQDRGDLALTAFTKAEAEQSLHLRLYRRLMGLKGATFTTPEELGELIVSAALIQAYEEAFQLRSAAATVKVAEERAAKLTGPDAAEFRRLVATAREVNSLVEQFGAKRYEDVMKGILAAEKNAQPTDQDFFVTEVRLLVACGKAMNEQAIIDHAREMLFFLAYEAGIKNRRIDQLWGLMGR